MGISVVIDDERTFERGDLHIRTSAEAISFLRLAWHVQWNGFGVNEIEELWLDHDLGGEDTTRPVAMWLAEKAFDGEPLKVGTVFVHTQNPVGRDWLMSTLKDYNPRSAGLPKGTDGSE